MIPEGRTKRENRRRRKPQKGKPLEVNDADWRRNNVDSYTIL